MDSSGLLGAVRTAHEERRIQWNGVVVRNPGGAALTLSGKGQDVLADLLRQTPDTFSLQLRRGTQVKVLQSNVQNSLSLVHVIDIALAIHVKLPLDQIVSAARCSDVRKSDIVDRTI